MRIEIRLDAGRAKRCGIVLDPKNMGNLMNLPNLPFTKFWNFQTVDVEKFVDALYPIQGLKNFRHALWAKRLQKVVNAPVADQIRFMKIACRGNKKLKTAMKRCVKDMSFGDVVNLPLPDDFFIAWRRGAGPLPDDGELPEKIELVPFVHRSLPGLPMKPRQKKLHISAEVPHNRPNSALTAAQSQNPIETMAQPEIAPRAAQEVVMRRTKWPKQPENEDGIFRLVELPAGISIAHAQIGQIRPYSAVSGAKIKNPIKPIGKSKTAPHKAHGDGLGP